MTQKQLAITLSKLDVFSSPKLKEEQYPTDSDIAANILWTADLNRDIENKTIADLGTGTGILGIGCLLLGAKKVFFVEKDEDAVSVLKKNLELFEFDNYEIVHSNIKDFTTKVDVVVQNPPFGTKNRHADLIFLEKAINLSKIIYSFHKTETKNEIERFIGERNCKTTQYFEFKFPLKQTMSQHRKKIERINVSCWRIEKR
ncbi:METTL5 family protein [Bacteroidota bacterium]